MFWVILAVMLLVFCAVPFFLGMAYETERLKRKGFR